MTEKPPVSDVTDADIEVGPPREWAAGVPGVLHSMDPAIKQLGLARTVKLMTSLNQKDGFDCMSCAWPDPGHRKTVEFCENGAKAVTWEATPGAGRAVRGSVLHQRPPHVRRRSNPCAGSVPPPPPRQGPVRRAG